MSMDDRWRDIGSWVGEELRREAFFFDSGGVQLFGSLYAAVPLSRPTGVVICNSWGFEGNQSDITAQRIALTTARTGGAGLVFHYAGFGDSHGDLAEATMEALANAAVDAIAEGSRRLPGTSWVLAGLMFGSAVAALGASRADIDRLLLVQPALRVSAYFSRLERIAKRSAPRMPARAGHAYGYPLPRRILAAAPGIDAAVARALEEFAGGGAVVRHAEPPRSSLIPAHFDDAVAPGTWRFGARQKTHLADTASRWLRDPGAKTAA